MRYLKVNVIVLRPTPNHKQFRYPVEYDAEQIYNMLYYEEGGEQYCIGLVKDDENAERFLESTLISEITREEFIALGEANYVRGEIVEDEDTVLRIAKKAAKGEPILPSDRDAMNPDHPRKGIKRKKTFIEKLEYREGVL